MIFATGHSSLHEVTSRRRKAAVHLVVGSNTWEREDRHFDRSDQRKHYVHRCMSVKILV